MVTTARFSAGTRVIVRIRKDKDYFEAPANVAHSAEDGMGLMFYKESTESLLVLLKWLKQAKESIAKWSEKRRSQRIALSIPVVLHRRPPEGPPFSEMTQTLVVNAHGALTALVEKVAPEQNLVMQNTASGEQKDCRVVYIKKELSGPTRVAVEFAQAAPKFWRILDPPADWSA